MPDLVSSTAPLRVIVVDSDPAGVYASNALMKSGRDVTVDLYRRLLVPFGFIRYGVAPDHPRIGDIIKSLHRVLGKPQVRLLDNVDVGKQVSIDELRQFYNAIIFATGAIDDRDLNIPGSDLLGHYGAGEFIDLYDSHPEFTRGWGLSAESVAAAGVGNVGLDVVRALARTADELHVTEIVDSVYGGLAKNAAREIHIFDRRDPAQTKFIPLKLKELGHSDTVEIVMNPENIQCNVASETSRRESKITDQVCAILEKYAIHGPKGVPHKFFIHFFESPVETIGETGEGEVQRVSAIRTKCTELDGEGGVRGVGKFTKWLVGVIYRVVGCRSGAVAGVPFDIGTYTIPDTSGHVFDDIDGNRLQGLHTTGWIRHGSVGLIGNTKGDANEMVGSLIAGWEADHLAAPAKPTHNDVDEFLADKGLQVITWKGWYALGTAERVADETEGRKRKKLAEWAGMVAASTVVVKQPDINDVAEAIHEAVMKIVAS